MYGLIHTALREMVVEHHGRSVWNSIVDESGVSDNAFLTMRVYEDATTQTLVDVASKVLNLPAEDCLEIFGEYWTHDFAPREYAQLMDYTGQSFFEFLDNLNDLHDRIATAFTDFSPPGFRLEVVDDTSAWVHYFSSRKALTPFVVGLLKGLGDRFGQKITVETVKTVSSDTGENSSIFVRVEGHNV